MPNIRARILRLRNLAASESYYSELADDLRSACQTALGQLSDTGELDSDSVEANVVRCALAELRSAGRLSFAY